MCIVINFFLFRSSGFLFVFLVFVNNFVYMLRKWLEFEWCIVLLNVIYNLMVYLFLFLVIGVLKGFDVLLNVVLDNIMECLRGNRL